MIKKAEKTKLFTKIYENLSEISRSFSTDFGESKSNIGALDDCFWEYWARGRIPVYD